MIKVTFINNLSKQEYTHRFDSKHIDKIKTMVKSSGCDNDCEYCIFGDMSTNSCITVKGFDGLSTLGRYTIRMMEDKMELFD